MNTKKFLQFLVLAAFMLAMIASTSPAYAAPALTGQCGSSVTVVSGDTLRQIAARCGTTVSALRRANPNIGSGDLIYPNQVLNLPGAILGTDGGFFLYVVARGDTLRGLATRFATTVDALLAANPNITNRNVIYEGQLLKVFVSSPTPPPSTPPPAPSGQVYYVRRGDTLRNIASRLSTTVDELLRLNPQITNPNQIYVGQAITIPSTVPSYIVQRGDTLRIIANKFGTTVDALLRLNPNITNANLIYVGQVINVR